jgi:hypothetical protein
MITELRLLPPLAIARFGAAPTPMDNYDAVVDPARPLGHRRLVPAETLRVDPVTGEIAEVVVPARVAFKQNGLVRPVAPFLELWALTDAGQLEALTTALLEADGATAADVQWQVQLANHKAARRTGDPDDRIEAETDVFSDHARHELRGRSPNFWPGKSIPFGHARYIKPTDDHPEIRLRFTPGPGQVYGASRTRPAGGPADPNVVDVVYDGNRGGWLGYVDGRPAPPGEPQRPPVTAPGGSTAQSPHLAAAAPATSTTAATASFARSSPCAGSRFEPMHGSEPGRPRTPPTRCRSGPSPTSSSSCCAGPL